MTLTAQYILLSLEKRLPNSGSLEEIFFRGSLDMNIKTALVCCLIVTGLTQPVMSEEKQVVSAAETTMPAVAEVKTRSITASLAAINYVNRILSLKDQNDAVFDLKVSTGVKNLKQFKAGDLVVIDFVETFTIFARKNDGGKPRKMTNGTVQVIRPGIKPMKVRVTTEEIISEVAEIDPEKRVIVLNTPSGGLQTFFVPRQYRHLENVKKGDQVVVHHSRSDGICVTKVSKAPKPKSQAAPVPSAQ